MVKNSLQSLLDKFPYFLNKNKDSNFYKVQWVNNENFKTLYNDLFKIYESFHLTKRLLIWKEQSIDYDYSINFVANYPNLKSVEITKNDELIYMETYTEEEEKDTFNFTYNCEYVIANLLELYSYKCDNCNNITFSATEQTECNECIGHHPLTQVNIYQCDDCGEIYFATEQPETCTTCDHENFTLLKAYRCGSCGQMYFAAEIQDTCPECGAETYLKPVGRDIYYNDPSVIMNDNRMEFPEDTTETVDDETVIGNPEYVEPEEENESFTNPTDSIQEDGDEEYVIPIPVIPSDQFIITVTTHDEYTLTKGFPENDKTYEEYKNSDKKYDVFDHDYSLDEFGKLNDIPRKTYIDVDNRFLYNLTEPPYNDRLTEDDYHYMNRILEFNLRMWAKLDFTEYTSQKEITDNEIRKIYRKYSNYLTSIGIDEDKYVEFIKHPKTFNQEYNPISLEIWKLYGLPARLINRERLLLKMFDETKHDFNEETGLVECWKPETWEHKDKFCDGSTSLGEYFFVEADTIRPVLYQNVIITFKLLNSLAEEINDDYLVDIYYYLEGDTCPDTPIRANYEDKTAIISHKLFQDNLDKAHVLRFVAHTSDNEVIGTEELLFNVRNCDDGDWYVASNGDDITGDGSNEKPFKTLQKALSVVSRAMDLIIVKGNLVLSDEASIPVINTNCTIMGCDENASITSNYYREFFHLTGSKNVQVQLVNITLKNTELVSRVELVNFMNTNKDFYDYETVVIHGGSPVLEARINHTEYYPYDNINVKGTLTSKEGIGLPEKTLTLTLNETLIGNITTNNNGGFDEWIHINNDYTDNTQDLYLKFEHPDYFENTQEWQFNYKQPINIVVKLGQSIRLTSNGYEPGDSVDFYSNDDDLINTVTADNNGAATLSWTPDWGHYIVYTYDMDSEAICSEWIIDTSINISDLPSNEFVDSITFKENGDFELTTKTVNCIRDMADLLLDLSFNDDLRYIETHHVLPSDYSQETLDGSDLTPYEFEIFKQAITDITVDDNGDLKLHRLEMGVE